MSGTPAISPLLLDYGSSVVRASATWPLIRRRWPEVMGHWNTHRRYILGVAMLSPLAFIMVLTAT